MSKVAHLFWSIVVISTAGVTWASGEQGARTGGPGTTPFELSVFDFGAVCDGVTDDARALQAALNAAAASPSRILRLPARTCAFSKPLVAGGGLQVPYHHVSVIGVTEDLSQLLYTGPNTDTAITLSHVGYSRWENLTIVKSNETDFAAHGKSTGVLITGSFKSGGTKNTALSFSHFTVRGFRYGMIYGGDDAASEIVCVQCSFQFNDVGWTASGHNSLNFTFIEVGLLFNARGMEIGGDGKYASQVTTGIKVIGGSTAGNAEADFFVGNSFYPLTIEHMRSEPRARFLIARNADAIVLRDNVVQPQTAPGDGVVISLESFSSALLEQNHVQGLVNVGAPSSGDTRTNLVMRQNIVQAAPSGLPVAIANRMTGLHLTLTGNTRHDPKGVPGNALTFPDFTGTFTSALTPWQTTGRDITDPAGGGLFLNAVRMLAYGSTVSGRNLRDRVTFEGTGRQTFTFRRQVSVTVSRDDDERIAFAPGTITSADIGKTISITGAARGCDYNASQPKSDNLDARIVQLDDPAHATIAVRAWFHGSARCKQTMSTSGTVNATVGEDEPDANYFLFVSCDANERVSWSNKSATGFTLTSDNPASRATCDVLIVR